MDQWPLHSFLELGALPGAVPCAASTQHVLWEWGLAGLAEDTELVVSEMITNGVQASRAMTQAAVRLLAGLRLGTGRHLGLGCQSAAASAGRPRADARTAGTAAGRCHQRAMGLRTSPTNNASTGAPAQRGKVVWAVVQVITGQRPGKGDSNGGINAGEGDDTVPGDRFSLGMLAAGAAQVMPRMDHPGDDPPPAVRLGDRVLSS